MTHANHPSEPLSLNKRILIGLGVGLALAAVFLFPVMGNDHPAWGRFWMIKPLIMMPFAGAMAGLCNYYILRFGFLVGINKPVAIIISLVVSVVGLWMGIVLGLNGTMWN